MHFLGICDSCSKNSLGPSVGDDPVPGGAKEPHQMHVSIEMYGTKCISVQFKSGISRKKNGSKI